MRVVIVIVIVIVTGGKQSQLLAFALGLGWSLTKIQAQIVELISKKNFLITPFQRRIIMKKLFCLILTVPGTWACCPRIELDCYTYIQKQG